MPPADRGCGALHALYTAARDGDPEAVDEAWQALDTDRNRIDPERLDQIAASKDDAEYDQVAELAAAVLFGDEERPALDGRLARLLGTLLYVFGYAAASVLFFRARSRESVVRRLRWAYRTVGVDIRATETVDGIERTVFRCPYQGLGANQLGERRACHDVLDRVDDGYVTYLDRHRDIDYQRPRACTASDCCYSEVAEQ
ncbi:MAG: hypothetical protein ABEH59_12565 [Halobacteriales archaeon]